MNDEQWRELLSALEPHWLESIAWSAAVLMGLAAVYALIFAHSQIKMAKNSTKALFIAELDRRWEGHEMKEARSKWRMLRNTIDAKIESKHKSLNTNDKINKKAEICSDMLYDMLKNDTDGYTSILSILGFFETVGYIVDRQFITANEIADLYGDSIMEFDRLCYAHIEKRREERLKETGVTTDLYDHARNLIKSTRKYYGIN